MWPSSPLQINQALATTRRDSMADKLLLKVGRSANMIHVTGRSSLDTKGREGRYLGWVHGGTDW